MLERILSVRSNLKACVGVRLEEEAKQEEERLARLAREREEREEKEHKWKESHPNLAKFCYCSVYSEYPSYGSSISNKKIYFYEWSDLSREPVFFGSKAALFAFFDRSGIMADSVINEMLNDYMDKTFYCVCRKDGQLLMHSNYDELKKLFEMSCIVGE